MAWSALQVLGLIALLLYVAGVTTVAVITYKKLSEKKKSKLWWYISVAVAVLVFPVLLWLYIDTFTSKVHLRQKLRELASKLNAKFKEQLDQKMSTIKALSQEVSQEGTS